MHCKSCPISNGMSSLLQSMPWESFCFILLFWHSSWCKRCWEAATVLFLLSSLLLDCFVVTVGFLSDTSRLTTCWDWSVFWPWFNKWFCESVKPFLKLLFCRCYYLQLARRCLFSQSPLQHYKFQWKLPIVFNLRSVAYSWVSKYIYFRCREDSVI